MEKSECERCDGSGWVLGSPVGYRGVTERDCPDCFGKGYHFLCEAEGCARVAENAGMTDEGEAFHACRYHSVCDAPAEELIAEVQS